MSAVNFRNRIAAAIGAIALALGSVVLTSAPASAADVTVNNAGDLAAAITGASAGDTITLGSSFSLTANLPQITVPLTIKAAGSGSITLDANDFDAFDVAAGAGAVTFEGFAITNAGTTNSTYAIHSQTPSLTVDDLAVSTSYGGIWIDGGGATVTHSSFQYSGRGVVLSNITSTTVTFSNDDFSHNSGNGLDAIISDDGVLNIDHSTANSNTNGYGFIISGSGSSIVTIDTIEADQNLYGGLYIEADEDAHVSVDHSVTNENDNNGTSFYSDDDGVMQLSNLSADSNNGVGIFLIADGNSSVTLTDVTSTNADDDSGFYVRAFQSSEVKVLGATVNGNDEDGLNARAGDSSKVNLSSITANFNGDRGVDLNATGTGTTTLTTAAANANSEGARLRADGLGASTTAQFLTVTGSTGDGGVELDPTGGARVELLDSTVSGSENTGVIVTTGNEDADGAVATIRRTTIKENGNAGAGGGGVTIWDQYGLTINIEDSTISDNLAGAGGGIYLEGEDGDDAPAFFLTLENSTVSGNVANTVGGIYILGFGLSEDSVFRILNSTITDNTTNLSGPAGVGIVGIFPSTIRNSIIGGNHDIPGVNGDLALIGPNLSVDYSLVQTHDSSVDTQLSSGTGNLTGVDPKLGPLANNGGPTFTHLPLAGSPAIGAGEPGFADLTYDQRGQDRVVDRLDMGAVEVQLADLAETGADVAWPLGAGAVVIGVGIALLALRRRMAVR